MSLFWEVGWRFEGGDGAGRLAIWGEGLDTVAPKKNSPDFRFPVGEGEGETAPLEC